MPSIRSFFFHNKIINIYVLYLTIFCSLKMTQSDSVHSQHSSPKKLQQNLQEPQECVSFAKLRPYWNYYFTSQPPPTLNLQLPIHKIIYVFKEATTKPFFPKIFKILDFDRHYYQASLDFSSFQKILKQEEDELGQVMLQIFNTFQYDAPAIIQAASLVLHGFILESKTNKRSKKVYLIIENYLESNINDIKANMIQNFINFQAVILKVYQVRLMAISLQFQCPDCKGSFTHYLIDGNFSQPSKCKVGKKECGCRNFILKKEKVKTIFIQRIKVQQIDSQGRTPRQVMCQLRDNNVGKVITGETVKLTGLIKTESSDYEKDKKTQGIFVPFILVNSIYQKTNHNNADYDHEFINQMKSNPNIFYSLIKSFCPTIYGHDIVKAGLLLGIIGGSSKNLSDQSTFRQTSHILLLGDPGIGKSQLLKFAVQILPHSVYVNSTATSTSGLTVTVNRQNNEQSLQAGALILSDNGVCAIDQFDKVSDSSSLLQVMQQQTISIAKAGVICQLKCRVGIIASANPINGCYNRAKSFKDNTKISNAILSRFDLIFLLVDKADPERDRKLAQHIMKVHNNKRKKKIDEDGTVSQKHNLSRYDDYLSLAEKYSKICQMEQQTYTLEQIKKYLAYVRQQIHPTLTRPACDVIKGFYLILRQNCPGNAFQITNRQLQSMVRLAMARARIQCRTEVTEADAIEVTQLMQESLFDSFQQMGYNTNALKYETKKAKIYKKNSQLSLPKQRILFISTLRQKAQQKNNQIWQWGELVKVAKQLELNIGDFYGFIERLNQDGILLQKGNKKYAFKDSFV